MAWDGARDKWFLRGGKLVRKPRSLRLTPKGDTANQPPYLARATGGGPFSQAPGVAIETDTAFARRQAAPLPTLLTQDGSNTDGTSFNTASVSVTLGRPVVVDVQSDSVGSGDDQTPTGITGPGGMTFTKVAETNPDADFVWQSRWVAVPTSTASGAITIAFNLTQDVVNWSVTEWTGTPATGTGTNMFSEHVTGNVALGAGTTDAEALASIAAANRPFAAFLAENTSAGVRSSTPDSGWTELSDVGTSGGSFSMAITSVWRDSNDDLSAGVTWTAGTGVKSAIISEVVFGVASFSAPPGVSTEADTARHLVMQKMRASEADTALALARRKLRATGLAAETDTALALARVKRRAAGVASETDTALALSRVKIRAVGLATETDTAFALARGGFTLPVGLTTETDAALALGRIKARAVALSTEVDAALALTRVKARSAALAAEADTAFALARVKLRATGRADEIDTALPLGTGGTITRPTGLAQETDAALALGFVAGAAPVSLGGRDKTRLWRTYMPLEQSRGVGAATEQSTAFALSAWLVERPRPAVALPALAAAECDEANALVVRLMRNRPVNYLHREIELVRETVTA